MWVLGLDLGLLFCYPCLNSTRNLEVQSLPWVGLGLLGRPVAFCMMLGTVARLSPEGYDPRARVALPRLHSRSVLTRP